MALSPAGAVHGKFGWLTQGGRFLKNRYDYEDTGKDNFTKSPLRLCLWLGSLSLLLKS